MESLLPNNRPNPEPVSSRGLGLQDDHYLVVTTRFKTSSNWFVSAESLPSCPLADVRVSLESLGECADGPRSLVNSTDMKVANSR